MSRAPRHENTTSSRFGAVVARILDLAAEDLPELLTIPDDAMIRLEIDLEQSLKRALGSALPQE